MLWENVSTPVTHVDVATFRRATNYLEPDADVDAQIAANLAAAQDVWESETARPLGARDIRFVEPACGTARVWYLPFAPVSTVTRVAIDRGGVETDVEGWRLVRGATHPQVAFAEPVTFERFDYLIFEATAGHTQTHEFAAQALIMIAREWQESATGVQQSVETKVSQAPAKLMERHRFRRFKVFD